MSDWPNIQGDVVPAVISATSIQSASRSGTAGTAGDATSFNWPVANMGRFYPVMINTPTTVQQVVLWATATAGGTNNVKAGIYDAQFNKIVVSAATVNPTANALLVVTFTATLLNPGRYYVFIAADNATDTFRAVGMGNVFNQSAADCWQQSTVYVTPPTTATPVESSNTRHVLFVLQARSIA